ncbi:MAG: hypothetical protein MJZ34_05350 [Paludibacteraceae bacterium]|nr:hypothetical protein [Paludibacteraceae bacterium]
MIDVNNLENARKRCKAGMVLLDLYIDANEKSLKKFFPNVSVGRIRDGVLIESSEEYAYIYASPNDHHKLALRYYYYNNVVESGEFQMIVELEPSTTPEEIHSILEKMKVDCSLKIPQIKMQSVLLDDFFSMAYHADKDKNFEVNGEEYKYSYFVDEHLGFNFYIETTSEIVLTIDDIKVEKIKEIPKFVDSYFELKS